MEWSSYCAICTKLFNRAEETLPGRLNKESASTPELVDPPPGEYSETYLRSAAQRGCCFCMALSSYLGGKSKPWEYTPSISTVLVFICRDEVRDLRILLYEKDEGWEDGYRGFFSVRPVSPGSEKLAMINEPDKDPYNRPSITVTPVCSITERAHSGDEKCMDIVRYWFQKCSTEHKYCCASTSRSSTTYLLPTRVIDVESKGKLRLMLTRDMKETCSDLRYATLSHRWSKEPHLILLEKNLDQLRQGFNLEDLPLVFQETIILLRRIRIRYLWIDCLCILQDSQEDWEVESSLMGHVYQNAYCNLGATEAALRICLAEDFKKGSKYYTGLFVEQNDPHRFFPTMLRIVRKDQPDTEYFAYTSEMEDPLRGGLMDRGWVFQERLMSPRSVYFGDMLTWECAEMVASEAFPDGTPVLAYTNSLAQGIPVRITTLLQRKSHEGVTDYQTRLYTTWLKLVQQYSECDLTYATDVLPALSGLALAFAKPLQDDYIAGLWRKDFLRGLLWSPWSPSSQHSNGEEYLGNMRKSSSREQAATKDVFPHEFRDFYDSEELEKSCLARGTTFHFAVTYQPTWKRVLGLILQATTVEDQYRRIGVFMHPFGPYNDYISRHHEPYTGSFRREDFPEFADFDPDDFKSETITII